MRRTAWLLAAAAAVAAVAAAAASAAGGTRVRITEAGGARFPERAYVLSLPARRNLTAADLSVTENGRPAIDVAVSPAAAAGGRTFGVVLLVDASQSMQGKPLASAMAAARAFAARRNSNQQLAFLTFNDKVHEVVPFTTSSTTIANGLKGVPSTAYGTHIYDAVARGLRMLRAARIDSGSIVVLSDGADLGSTVSPAAVLARARAAHVRLFAIGLRSPRFDPSTLRLIASGGGGEFAEARTPAELRPLYDRLGTQLAREYLLQYKSLAGPKAHVSVTVGVAGAGSARTAYVTPALPVRVVAPFHQSLAHRFWASPLVTVLVALLVVAMLLFALLAAFRRGNSGLRRRMGEFVTIAPSSTAEARRRSVLGTVLGDAEDTLGRRQFWSKFREEVEIGGIGMSAEKILAWTVVATIVVALLLDLITGSVWASFFALLIPLGVRAFVSQKLERRRRAFAAQLPDNLQVLASALRAGHSLAGALSVVVDSSDEPMRSEMQRVIADEQLGIPLEDAIETAVRRMANRDLEQLALVARLQRDAGGNAAEVIDRVAETVRERFELRRLVKTLTAQGRMSRWIVSGLPVAIALVILVIDPHYFHPLLRQTAGIVLLVVAGLLVLAGSYVIKRIIDIKV